MPFGMGPRGWFMWPYIAQWMGYGYPSLGGYSPYYGYPAYGAPYLGYSGYGAPYGYPQMSKEQEISMLRDQAKTLKQELDWINTRMEELQKAEQKVK